MGDLEQSGFWTIAFEFIMPDGKHISVTKNRNEGFTKNGPDTFLIPPGESQVYPVRLDTELGEGGWSVNVKRG